MLCKEQNLGNNNNNTINQNSKRDFLFNLMQAPLNKFMVNKVLVTYLVTCH